MRTLIAAFSVGLYCTAVWAQDTPARKPVLIRDDPPATQAEIENPLPDPAQAKESLKIGQFYFKRKNYKAASDRFRESIRFQPTWDEPYQKLVEALRKQGSTQEAIDACDLFLATNPDSDRAAFFAEMADKLRRGLTVTPKP